MDTDGIAQLKLRPMKYHGLSFRRFWFSRQCAQSRDHTVFVSKQPCGQFRLSVVERVPTVSIKRELVISDDTQAIRVLGLLMCHTDPVSFSDRVFAHYHAPSGTVACEVEAEICERIHRAERDLLHAA